MVSVSFRYVVIYLSSVFWWVLRTERENIFNKYGGCIYSLKERIVNILIKIENFKALKSKSCEYVFYCVFRGRKKKN